MPTLSQIRQLSVQATLDASGYQAGAAQKVAADQKMVEGSKAVDQAVQQTERRVNESAKGADRLEASVSRVYAAQRSAASSTERLNQLLAKGAIDQERHDRILGAINSRLQSVIASQRGAAAVAGQVGSAIQLQSHHWLNLSRQIQDVGVSLIGGQNPFLILAQQGPQAADAVGGVGRLAALAASQITPLRVGIAATAATMGVLTAQALALAGEQRAFEVAIKGAGRGSEIAAAQFRSTVEAMRDQGVAAKDARKAIEDLIRTTNLPGGQINRIAGLIPDFAAGRGIEAAEAGKALGDAFANGADGIKKLDDQLNFLTATEARSIDEMARHGNQAGALETAIEALERRYQGLARDALSPAEQAVNQLGRAWTGFIQAVVESSPVQSQIRATANALREIRFWINGYPEDRANMIPADLLGLSRLQDQLKTTRETIAAIQQEFRGGLLPPREEEKIRGLSQQADSLSAQIDALNKKRMEEAASAQTATAATSQETNALQQQAKAVDEIVRQSQTRLALDRARGIEQARLRGEQQAEIEIRKNNIQHVKLENGEFADEAVRRAKINEEVGKYRAAEAHKAVEKEAREREKLAKALRDEVNARAAAYDKDRLDAQKRGEKLIEDDLKEASQLFASVRTEAEKYADTQRLVAGYVSRGSLSQAQANAILERADPAYEKAKKAAEEYAKEVQRAAEHTTDRIVDFGGDTLFNALSGKSKDFWQEFQDLALKAFSQIAAEAILRPIVAPIVGSVAGSAPGFFGVTGAPGASGSGQLSAGGINLNFGGGGNLFGGIDSLATRYLPGVFSTTPQVAASTYGISAGQAALLNNQGSFAGALPFAASDVIPVIGSALPGLISGNYAQAGLGALGAGLGLWAGGPIGAAVGGLAGNLLGGLFGSKPKTKAAGALLDLETASLETASKVITADEVTAIARRLLPSVQQSISRYGVDLAAGTRFGVGYSEPDGYDVKLVGPGEGAYLKQFKVDPNNPAEALADITLAMVQMADAVANADVKAVAATLSFEDTAETIQKVLDGAAAFRDNLALMADGFDPAIAQMTAIRKAAEEFGAGALKTVQDFADLAGRIGGAAGTEANDAMRAMLDTMLGLKEAKPALTDLQVAFEQAKANIAELSPVLSELGYTADEAAAKIAAANEALISRSRAQFERGFLERSSSAIGGLKSVADFFGSQQQNALTYYGDSKDALLAAGEEINREFAGQVTAALDQIKASVVDLSSVSAYFARVGGDAGNYIARAASQMLAVAAGANQVSADRVALRDRANKTAGGTLGRNTSLGLALEAFEALGTQATLSEVERLLAEREGAARKPGAGVNPGEIAGRSLTDTGDAFSGYAARLAQFQADQVARFATNDNAIGGAEAAGSSVNLVRAFTRGVPDLGRRLNHSLVGRDFLESTTLRRDHESAMLTRVDRQIRAAEQQVSSGTATVELLRDLLAAVKALRLTTPSGGLYQTIPGGGLRVGSR